MTERTRRPRTNPLGRRARALREGLGLGLREAAGQLDISPSYLSQLENGRLITPPAAKVLHAMARRYEVSSDELVLLAGRLPDDVRQLLLADHDLTTFLRAAGERGLSGEDLLALLRDS